MGKRRKPNGQSTVDTSISTEPRTSQTVGILLPGVLTYKNAGLTGSAIARTTALSKVGIDSTLLTHVWQPFVDAEVQQLVTSGRLSSNIPVRNLFDDLKELFGRNEAPHSNASIEIATTQQGLRLPQFKQHVPELKINSISTSYDTSGSYIYEVTIQFQTNNSTRLLADANGTVARTQQIDEAGRVTEDVYLDHRGKPFLKYGTSDAGKTGYTVLETTGNWQWIGNKQALIAFWIKTCFSDTPLSILISEMGPHAIHIEALSDISRSTPIKTIITLHSNHLTPPFRDPFKVRKEFDSAFRKIDQIDSLVVLTEQQKIDIIKLYGTLDKIHVIPHSAEETRSQGLSETEPNVAAIVSRIDPGKGHLPLIREIARNKDKWNGYKVEIWGNGQLVDEVKSAITENSVEGIVSYCGFTTNPTDVYSRAAIALFPNTKEAQPLSVLEAMAAGAVPVAFDFKYGARAMIQDCVTGLLVDPGDFRDLSASALTMLKNRKFREEYSQKSREVTSQRTPEILGHDWSDLFEAL